MNPIIGTAIGHVQLPSVLHVEGYEQEFIQSNDKSFRMQVLFVFKTF